MRADGASDWPEQGGERSGERGGWAAWAWEEERRARCGPGRESAEAWAPPPQPPSAPGRYWPGRGTGRRLTATAGKLEGAPSAALLPAPNRRITGPTRKGRKGKASFAPRSA